MPTVVLARLFLLLAVSAAALPQLAHAAGPGCVTPHIRHATGPEGAVVTMQVVNDGRPCSRGSFADVEATLPWTTQSVADAPHAGEVTITPGRITYLPKPTYTGSDSFTDVMTGQTAKGRLVSGRLHVDVTVLPPQ